MKKSLLPILLSGLIACSAPQQKDIEKTTPMTYQFLVGTYTNSSDQGIDFLTVSPESDSINLKNLVPNFSNPSFVLANQSGSLVFSLQEEAGKGGGKIASFKRDISTNHLILIDSLETGGDHPCHIALSPNEDFLILSNYTGGSLSAFKVGSDGNLAFSQLIQHEGKGTNPDRQEGPHVHSSTFDKEGKHVLVADLGTNGVYVYNFTPENEAPLSLKEKVEMTPGDGPRHLAFSPDGKEVYVVQEMTAVLEVFDYQDGKMTSKQRLSLLEEGFEGAVGAAEVRVSPDGKNIYVSNRGDANTISAFRKGENGSFELIAHYPSGGIMPRNFNLTPDGKYLISAHQKSGDIVVFDRNLETGELKETSLRTMGNQPVYLFPIN
jgi:6-phosphogluconolactonase (cycloisomerase 2 family)